MIQEAIKSIPYVLFKAPRPEFENAAFFLQAEISGEDLEFTVIAKYEGKEVFHGWCTDWFPLFPVAIEVHYPCQDAQIHEQIAAYYTSILAEKSSLVITEDTIELTVDNHVFDVTDTQDVFFQIPITDPDIAKNVPIKLPSCSRA
ncbi:MAG: hypothetical protein Q8R40_02445 [bacterium]|nr:hypothetical protein [bacterium]